MTEEESNRAKSQQDMEEATGEDADKYSLRLCPSDHSLTEYIHVYNSTK